MKRLLTIFVVIIIALTIQQSTTGCSSKVKAEPDTSVYYIDVDFTIVEKGFGKEGKKYFLIKGVKDTTLYSVYYGISHSANISDASYYNKYIGDVLHFDYIKKNRFFHIQPKKNEYEIMSLDY